MLGSWGDDLRERTGLSSRTERDGSAAGLLITGAVIIGLGYLAWTYLGPDLKRYLKIHSM
jgi:hypothetical protein